MNERNVIGVRQNTIEPTETGLRVSLDVVYGHDGVEERVLIAVDLPRQDSTLKQLQKQAIERAKDLLDLCVAASTEPPGEQDASGDVLSLWKKLGA